MIVTSRFDPRRTVDLDPYGRNPLEEDMKGGGAYAAAKSSGVPVPKMFQGGTSDVPAFTASGIDPQLLLKLPYTMRHAVAAEPDPATVHGIFEQYADQPDYVMPHEGLDAAVARMSHWASTAGIDTVRDNQRAAEQAADARRVADLRRLPPERRAVIHQAAGQP